MVGVRAACGCGLRSRTVTGSRPPWLLDYARPGSARPMCSRAPSTASGFASAPGPAKAGVEQMLVPTLGPGDIVLLDNLRSHKVAGIAEAIAARGAQLIYLPPYSPDLNP